MIQAVLIVPNITCEHCDRTITNALNSIAGIRSLAVDIPAKHVQLEYDPDRVNLDQIKAILDEQHYPVASVASSNQPTMKGSVPVADTLNTTTIDPVCGMGVDPETAHFTADHEGQTYYFCSPSCTRTFEQNPARYRAASEKSSKGRTIFIRGGVL